MKSGILRYHPETEFYTEEACYITELLNRPENADLSIARARVEPGVTTQWHTLDETVERYLILEGEGKMELGERDSETLSEMDIVNIPAGCRQRITNTGDRDLVFLAICTPRFKPENYNSA